MKGAAAAASGIVFCGCEWLGMAHAQSSAGPTLPVAVNGKRVKTIDVHAHCLFHEAATLMGDDNAAFRATVKGAPAAFIAIETRLKAMDAMAVDMEVLSINPFWYSKERDLAAEIVRIQNEKLAELCAAQPDRFAAFASLALQYPTWRCSSSKLRSRSKAYAAQRLAAAWPAPISPTPSWTSGRMPPLVH